MSLLFDGREMTIGQARTLAALIQEWDEGKSHWHFNDCGCCVTLHGPGGSHVIGRDGEAEFFAGRHCGCEEGKT